MAEHPHQGRVLPVDSAMGDDANPLAAQSPVSLDEVNDYLYDESRSTAERLDRLREMRDGLAGLAATDMRDDVETLRAEISAAIVALEDGERGAPQDAANPFDPADHIEAQSPDDDEAIERITGEDEDRQG